MRLHFFLLLCFAVVSLAQQGQKTCATDVDCQVGTEGSNLRCLSGICQPEMMMSSDQMGSQGQGQKRCATDIDCKVGAEGANLRCIDGACRPEGMMGDQGGMTMGDQGMMSQGGQQGSSQQESQQEQTISESIQNNSQLSQVLQLLQKSNLLQQLSGQSLTFFLPNNAGLSQMLQNLQDLPQDRLSERLKLHISSGLVPLLSDGVRTSSLVPGEDLTFKQTGQGFTVNGATVVHQFVPVGKNQGYYIIDRVLSPSQGNQGGQGSQGGSMTQPAQ
eukprot:TRINITY_DN6319_c0_g1_i1.p1 TRINITY_DN6319_c0_g1~~TRINITY_DN6319_c0_g1_i1.p1  ORF type:complete len:274 (+),score=50.52 TRINITY_DN6319_c0_g1_i1:231-1052(+)